MNAGRLAYLGTIVVFALGAVLVEWALKHRELRPHARLIAAVAGVATLGTVLAERTALSWRTWTYNPRRTLGLHVGGAAAETLLFAALVAVAVASAALVWSDGEDAGESGE